MLILPYGTTSRRSIQKGIYETNCFKGKPLGSVDPRQRRGRLACVRPLSSRHKKPMLRWIMRSCLHRCKLLVYPRITGSSLQRTNFVLLASTLFHRHAKPRTPKRRQQQNWLASLYCLNSVESFYRLDACMLHFCQQMTMPRILGGYHTALQILVR